MEYLNYSVNDKNVIIDTITGYEVGILPAGESLASWVENNIILKGF